MCGRHRDPELGARPPAARFRGTLPWGLCPQAVSRLRCAVWVWKLAGSGTGLRVFGLSLKGGPGDGSRFTGTLPPAHLRCCQAPGIHPSSLPIRFPVDGKKRERRDPQVRSLDGGLGFPARGCVYTLAPRRNEARLRLSRGAAGSSGPTRSRSARPLCFPRCVAEPNPFSTQSRPQASLNLCGTCKTWSRKGAEGHTRRDTHIHTPRYAHTATHAQTHMRTRDRPQHRIGKCWCPP